MYPATVEEYDKMNEWRNGDDRRSELNALLSPHVKSHVSLHHGNRKELNIRSCCARSNAYS